jgi:hypothetical protein
MLRLRIRRPAYAETVVGLVVFRLLADLFIIPWSWLSQVHASIFATEKQLHR